MHDSPPSAAYDGATTLEAIRAVNRREHAAMLKRIKYRAGDNVPLAAVDPLGEDLRRALAAYYAANRPRVVTERVGGVVVTRAPRAPKVYDVLVCASCGEDKPENKFATIKPGVRGDTCRDCIAAARAARKSEVSA